VEELLIIIAARGGYFTDPPQSFPLPVPQLGTELLLPLYDKENPRPFPSTEHLEQQLSLAVRKTSDQCFDFSQFPQHVNSDSEITVTAHITDEQVTVNVHRPVTIRTERASTTMEDYTVTLQSPLAQMHHAAKSIIEESSCLSCLTAILPEGMTIDETVFFLDDSVISIRTLRDDELVYNFAERVPFTEGIPEGRTE
jgi:hypothetical protein